MIGASVDNHIKWLLEIGDGFLLSKKYIAALAFLVFGFLFARFYIAARESLWTDELWSLSVSTGHLTCQRSDQTISARGDYIEVTKPMPLSFRRYVAFDPQSKLTDNIVRTCLIGDHNTPLYFLLVGYWLKLVGISDFSLRLPSIVFSFFSMPFIWLIAEKLSGKKAAFISCALFALAPMSLFFSTEARVYSLLVLLSSILLWITLLLPASKGRVTGILAMIWSIVAGIGMLSDPLFLVPILSAIFWFFGQRKSFLIKLIPFMLLGVLAISLFWYIRLPEQLAMKNNVTVYYAGRTPFVFALIYAFTHLLILFSSFGNDAYCWRELFSLFFFLTILPAVLVILPVFKNQRINSLLEKVFLVGNIFSWFAGDVCGAMDFSGFSRKI